MLAWLGWVGIFLLTCGVLFGLGALSRSGVFGKLRGVAFSVVLLSLGSLCLGFWVSLRSFEAFSRSTLVAEVHCRWFGQKQFALSLVPVRHGTRQPAQTFRLRGDQWTISGGIVKWHPWLTALGVPSYHKLTRVSGRFAKAAEEQAAPASAFELNGGVDWVWWWLYRLDPYLPFVEAAYGSAAFAYVEPTWAFEVYVTPSGYVIQRPEPRRVQGSRAP